jgi:hypothetical protein
VRVEGKGVEQAVALENELGELAAEAVSVEVWVGERGFEKKIKIDACSARGSQFVCEQFLRTVPTVESLTCGPGSTAGPTCQ